MSGTISERFTYCSHKGCACRADPPRPHGPYWQWTRKIAGKTITRRMTAEQAKRYRPWIENMRRMRELLGELDELSLARAQQQEGWDVKPSRARGQNALGQR